MLRCLLHPQEDSKHLADLIQCLDGRVKTRSSPSALDHESVEKLRLAIQGLRPLPPSLFSPHALVFRREGQAYSPASFFTPWYSHTLQDCLLGGKGSQAGKAEKEAMHKQWKAASLLTKLQLVAWLAQAMEWLHERRIIHLDIKPENIMLTKAPGEVLVLEHVEPGPSTAPLVLIDFSSAVVCVDPQGGLDSKELVLACSGASVRATGGGGIQTSPQYDYKKGSKTYNWSWDLYAFLLSSWQILLWSAGPESEQRTSLYSDLDKQLRSAAYTSSAFFTNSPLLNPSDMKGKLEGLKGDKAMAEFFKENLGLTEISMAGCVTASKCCPSERALLFFFTLALTQHNTCGQAQIKGVSRYVWSHGLYSFFHAYLLTMMGLSSVRLNSR